MLAKRLIVTLVTFFLLFSSALAHSVVYEDDDGHPLFRMMIPQGWAVSLDGNRISLFPETSSAFIGAWFLDEAFADQEAIETYIRTLCQTYFQEHNLEQPQQVVLDGGLEGKLYTGKGRRDQQWGALRALVFAPCSGKTCFAIQYTPDDVAEAPEMHKAVILKVHK